MVPAGQIEERRAYERMQIPLVCHVYRGEEPAQSGWPALGVTENISRHGVLIRWNGGCAEGALPQLGELIHLAIDWPLGEPSRPRHLRCVGWVVRAWAGLAHEPYTAVVISRMWFSAVETQVKDDLRGIPQTACRSLQ